MVLHPLHTDIAKPERFTYPFCYEPHPLCQLAAKEVQAEIARINPQEGKMFGVLVVEVNEKLKVKSEKSIASLGFLAAYSGLLEGRNDWDYFVPPVYDAQQPDGYFKTKEREISQLSTINYQLDAQRREMSQNLQEWLFHQYQLLNARGEVKDLVDIWQSYYDKPKLRTKFPMPPGGTGDCCAPKLLQYAYQHGLKPVCMAEFWWGESTKTELRQHLNYYPACRGKCKPILSWMLQGLEVDPDPELLGFQKMEIPVVYEDEWLLVVNKPSGMLSVPGRIEQYSVETVMQERYPGSKVAHRLDMGTSGLLIVAKTPDVYRALQEQFVKHQVKKKYIAVLEGQEGPIKLDGLDKLDELVKLEKLVELEEHSSFPTKGRIELPLRPDPMNRPRQVVDMEHGKRAVTDYEFISPNIVALYPQTGRTHQLRIHCAHPDGLGRPIVGDELYGTKGERLMLHAAEIWFHHPITGQEMHLVSTSPLCK
jgi:tRNA pseudouridine32 synthase/23S rRNA pseudouridine746 synthase